MKKHKKFIQKNLCSNDLNTHFINKHKQTLSVIYLVTE
nr:MAG TPA: hypothetical protein [Bacteriophage sp.]